MKLNSLDFSKIPVKSGVYFYKDRNGKVLYVGKAVSLRTRIKQYFNGDIDSKTKLMLSKAKTVDFKEMPSELLAAILEAKLIKEYRPKYNVLLKDDKRYLYVGITREEYPRVKLLRRPELENLLFYAGPFPSSTMIKQILQWVRRIFPYCSCKSGRKKPCLYYQMGLCLGSKRTDRLVYRKMIRGLILFLSGESRRLLKLLRKEMESAAKKLEYEKAAEVKKKIVFLENLIYSPIQPKSENLEVGKGLTELRKLVVKCQGVDPLFIQRIEAYDIANFGAKIITGAMSVLENGEPNPKEYRRFKVCDLGQDDSRCIAQIVERRLKHQEWIYPQVIIIDGGQTQLSAVISVLERVKLIGQIGLLGLTKREEILIAPRIIKSKICYKRLVLPRSSLALKLLQSIRDEAHRFGQNYLHKKQKI